MKLSKLLNTALLIIAILLFIPILLILISGGYSKIFAPENSQINPRGIIRGYHHIFATHRSPSWENFTNAICMEFDKDSYIPNNLTQWKQCSFTGFNPLHSQQNITNILGLPYFVHSTFYKPLAEYNALGREAILTQVANSILKVNVPFYLTESKESPSENETPNNIENLKQLEKVFLFLNTDLIPLIPFLEENFDNIPAFPAIVCALINIGEEALPSLLKTQSLDSELQRHLGLFGISAIALDLHAIQEEPSPELAQKARDAFLRYIENPSTNRFSPDSHNYNLFESYLNSIFCLALNGLTLYSSSPEQCMPILQKEAAQHSDPTVRWFALTQLGFIRNRFHLENTDPDFAEPILKITQSAEEELMVKTLAETLLNSERKVAEFEQIIRRTLYQIDINSYYNIPFGNIVDGISMTRVMLPFLPDPYDTLPYATVWDFKNFQSQYKDRYPYPKYYFQHCR